MFNRNFSIILSTECLSSIGFGFYSIASMMLVLDLTGSPVYSGLAFFITQLAPALAFLISPFANYVRYKKGLINSQLIQAALLSTIPFLYWLDILHITYLLSVMFITGMINQFIAPIQNTLIPNVVKKDHVVKANSTLTILRESLNAFFFGVAGFVVAMIGAPYTFTITTSLFILSALVFTLLHIETKNESEAPNYKDALQNYTSDLKEGVLVVKDSLLIHFVLAGGMANFFCGMMIAAIPLFAVSLGGEHYFGFFMVAFSCGALIGSVLAGKLESVKLGVVTIISTALCGGFWIVTPLIGNVYSLLTFSCGAIFLVVNNVLIFSSIQTSIESRLIGRVTTVLSSFSAITLPIGSLVGGFIATKIGIPFTVLLGGAGMLLYTFYWLLHSRLRKLPIIEELQLLPGKEQTKSSII